VGDIGATGPTGNMGDTGATGTDGRVVTPMVITPLNDTVQKYYEGYGTLLCYHQDDT
jgi:hypothetical protein